MRENHAICVRLDGNPAQGDICLNLLLIFNIISFAKLCGMLNWFLYRLPVTNYYYMSISERSIGFTDKWQLFTSLAYYVITNICALILGQESPIYGESPTNESFVVARTQSSIMPSALTLPPSIQTLKTTQPHSLMAGDTLVTVANGTSQVSPVLITSTSNSSHTVAQPILVPGSTQPVLVGGTGTMPGGAYVLYNPNLVMNVSSGLTTTGNDTLTTVVGSSTVQQSSAVSVPQALISAKKLSKTRANIIPTNVLPPGIDPNQPLSPEFIATHMLTNSSPKAQDTKTNLIVSPIGVASNKTGTVTVDSTGRPVLSQTSPILQTPVVPQSPLTSDMNTLTPAAQLAMSPTDITAANILAPISPTSLMPQIAKCRDKVPAWRSK